MIVIDIEATGLNPEKCSIVSIGAVELENPQNQFYIECRVPKGTLIEEKAMKINGFTTKQIKDLTKPTVAEMLKQFKDWTHKCKERTFAGMNVGVFDVQFLKKAIAKSKIEWNFGYRSIDLHSVCYAHILQKNKTPPTKNKRTDLQSKCVAEYVGIPNEKKPHNALTGAKWEAEAFSRLFFGKILLKEYKECPVPKYLL